MTTGLENLRVLKQSLEDYCMLVNRLSEDIKIQVIRLLRSHYHEALDIPNVDNLIRYYQEDLNTLPDIINQLKQQKESCQLVDRENVVLLIESLERASQKMKDVLRQPKGE